MNKKWILIFVIVFIIVTLISTILFYNIFNGSSDNKTKVDIETPSDSLSVEDYNLKYGTYKGFESEYNNDTEKVEKKEVTIALTKDKINGEYYIVKGKSLYVNGYEMYKAIANNKIELLAGEGVIFEYEGK